MRSPLTRECQGSQVQQVKMQGTQLNLNVRKIMHNIFYMYL